MPRGRYCPGCHGTQWGITVICVDDEEITICPDCGYQQIIMVVKEPPRGGGKEKENDRKTGLG